MSNGGRLGISGTELAYRRTVALAQGGYLKYTEPTEDEIKRYREEEYPTWFIEEFKQMLVGMVSAVESADSICQDVLSGRERAGRFLQTTPS